MTATLFSAVLFPKSHIRDTAQPHGMNPMQGKGSATKRSLCSLFFGLWLLGAFFVAFLFLATLGWDHSFGHPPYGVWVFTALYACLGVFLYKGSHRSAEMFGPSVEKLKAAGFEPELELLSAECYAGFSRLQDRLIVMDNVHNTVIELPMSEVDKMQAHSKVNGGDWSIVELLTRRLDLPRVCLRVRPSGLGNWTARLRIMLNLE